MHRITIVSIFISILVVLTASNLLRASSPEETYFASRDRIIGQFENETKPIDERPALAELERQMRAIIGPIRIKGFSGQGTINILTLRDDADLDQVDSLRFNAGGTSLVVTTDTLLNHYLRRHPTLPRTLNELAKSGDFYRRVFHADAGVTHYGEIPVTRREGQTFVYASLGVSSQDIGPLIPTEIFVIVSMGKRLFLVNAPAAEEITDIPQCRKEWETFHLKSAGAYERYRSSELTDKKAFDDSLRYREQGFEAYYRCFGREAPNRPFFGSLTRQAQSIVDCLQRAGLTRDKDQRLQ